MGDGSQALSSLRYREPVPHENGAGDDHGGQLGIAVLPGPRFYVDGGGEDTVRLNFTSSGEDEIWEGM